LAPARANALLAQLDGWQLVEARLQKEYRFPSYRQGLEFAYRLGQLAEEENHHPEMWIGWERVKVTLTTFAIGGLSENDFILAAKADQAYAGQSAT
jgi:4a-hydroxytetrahydrobiopterin dehydratase